MSTVVEEVIDYKKEFLTGDLYNFIETFTYIKEDIDSLYKKALFMDDKFILESTKIYKAATDSWNSAFKIGSQKSFSQGIIFRELVEGDLYDVEFSTKTVLNQSCENEIYCKSGTIIRKLLRPQLDMSTSRKFNLQERRLYGNIDGTPLNIVILSGTKSHKLSISYENTHVITQEQEADIQIKMVDLLRSIISTNK